MNKRSASIIILTAALALLIGGASLLYGIVGKHTDTDQLSVRDTGAEETVIGSDTAADTAADTDTEAVDYTAPDFTVTDLDGNSHKLTDYFGTPIVLNFWASWCSPCKNEMPHFDEASKEYEGKVQFLMVNMTDGSRETVKKASEFIASKGYSFPVLYDTASEAAITYAVYSIPTTYFIDSDGNLIAQATGAIDADTLMRGIDMIYPESDLTKEAH